MRIQRFRYQLTPKVATRSLVESRLAARGLREGVPGCSAGGQLIFPRTSGRQGRAHVGSLGRTEAREPGTSWVTRRARAGAVRRGVHGGGPAAHCSTPPLREMLAGLTAAPKDSFCQKMKTESRNLGKKWPGKLTVGRQDLISRPGRRPRGSRKVSRARSHRFHRSMSLLGDATLASLAARREEPYRIARGAEDSQWHVEKLRADIRRR